MSIEFRIYANDGLGGPVDYSTVIATVSVPTYTPAALSAPSDNTFAVRAFDTVTGLEERNTDATVRIVVGADAVDRTAVPARPIGLAARATSGGGGRVDFTYVATGQRGAPNSWQAWLFAGAADFTLPPTLTVPANWPPVGEVYRLVALDLAGLSDGVAYRVGVRAANAAGTDGNTATVEVTGRASGPSAVSGLAASAGYGPIT